MPPTRGVRFQDLRVGTGKTAGRRDRVVVELSIRLNHGEVVLPPEDHTIDLGRRDAIAGLRYGIEGMRVGGRREIIVPPHLGYGTGGVPGSIPAARFSSAMSRSRP